MTCNKKAPVVSVVIASAGNSTRMKTKNSKQFLEIDQKPIIAYTIDAFEKSQLVKDIVIVARECDILYMWDIVKSYGFKKVTDIVPGGETRTESVKNGIVRTQGEFVAIHDGARPCIQTQTIDSAIISAFKDKAVVVGCPVTDTLKSVNENGIISATVDRSSLWQMQTPQIFEKELILKAYQQGDTSGATDDCMLLESIGVKITVVNGDRRNIKVTVPEDLTIAKAILKGEQYENR